MTKGELIRALEPYADDQPVNILLHSATYPGGSQVLIQAAAPYMPWHGDARLIGLVCSDTNAIVPPRSRDDA